MLWCEVSYNLKMYGTSTIFTLLLAAGAAFAKPMPTQTRRQSSTKYHINFGDSYSQVGFNASSTLPSANNILGNPAFPGWTTVNGNLHNWLDTLISSHNTTIELAANLAVGGATTDADLVAPYAPFPTVYSFKDQVGDFSTYLASSPSGFPWSAADTLFSVWMGVNDVGMGWYSSSPAWDDLVLEVLDEYFSLVDRLYQAGGRKFLFLTVPPTQLTPYAISLGDYTVQALAAAIPQYNSALQSHVANFTSTYSDAKAWVYDTTSSFNETVANPTEYGAANATCYDATGTECLWYNNCESTSNPSFSALRGACHANLSRPSRAGNS